MHPAQAGRAGPTRRAARSRHTRRRRPVRLPGVAITSAGPRRNARVDLPASRGHDERAGERAADLLGGAPGADDSRANPRCHRTPDTRSCPSRTLVSHQRHRGSAPAAATAIGPWHAAQRTGSRQVPQESDGRYPRRGTCTSTGPVSSAASRRPPSERMAGGRRPLARPVRRPGPPPPTTTRAAAARATCAAALTSARTLAARPAVAPRRCARTRRPARAAPVCSARIRRTSPTCGYGALGSRSRSSPSSHQATRPRSRTGAKVAARVPTTHRTWPRSTLSQAVYRAWGPWSAVSRTCRPRPSTLGQGPVHARDVAMVGHHEQRPAARGESRGGSHRQRMRASRARAVGKAAPARQRAGLLRRPGRAQERAAGGVCRERAG